MASRAADRVPRADGDPRAGWDRSGPEEVELKLAVLDPAAIRALILDPARALPGVTPIGPARTVEIEDRYLDTPRRALRAAGVVARLRTAPDGRRLTVKSLARRSQGAIHRRLELDGNAGDGDPGHDADPGRSGGAGRPGDLAHEGARADPREWPASAARDRVLETVGREQLDALVTLRQRRVQRDIAIGASVVEMSLDEVEVAGLEGRHDRWTELECELRSGDEADLAILGEYLLSRPDLAPSATSKLERALTALGGVFTER